MSADLPPLPEWSKHDDLGGLTPGEIRVSLRVYARAALAAQAAKLKELQRWKSTNAPRLEALQGLLTAAQLEAHAGCEAVASLASEREANALLTNDVEALRAEVAAGRSRCGA